MSERLESITPEMDEPENLGRIIDELIGSKEPEVAKAIRLCAIPHWFNAEILAWLRGEGREPLERTGAILAELAKLVFVSSYRGRGYIYHENVRDLLLGRWRKENAGRFQELSGVAAAYYADKLQVGKSSEEQRAEWEREEMFHLLVADEGRGIDLFKSLCNRASELYRLSTFHLLLSLAYEQAADQSAGNRPWIQFFEGKLALLSGDWERALKVWETLEGEREQVSADLEKTLAVHLSFLYKDKGEWDKAVECFQHSLEILERAADEPGMITLLNNRGFLYKDREEWEKADADFRRGLEISEKRGDEREMAISAKNLGLLYKDQGEWDKAIERFQSSLAILERAGDERGMAITYNDLGFLYKDTGEWDKAIECFQQSQKNFDTLGDEHGKAAAFNSLGFLYTNKREWEKGREAFQRALEILEKMGDERRIADTFSYLGFLFRDNKEWQKADEYLWRGLEILEKMGDERGIAAMLNNLGLLYERKGAWEKAADYFHQSLKIVEKVGDEMNAATTMYDLALLYEDVEQYDEAVKLLEQVVMIGERAGHPDLRIRRSREILERVKKRRDE